MYRIAVIITAAICAGLFVVFLLIPNQYIAIYGVAGSDGVAFLGRRLSPLLLGVAVLLWMVRDLPDGVARQAVCYGIGVAFAGVAFTGMFEYGRGFASFSIFVAALSEFLIAAVFLFIARQSRRI